MFDIQLNNLFGCSAVYMFGTLYHEHFNEISS